MGFPGRNLLYGGVSESRRGQDKDRRRWSPVRVMWWASLCLALQGRSQVASAFKPGRLIGLERLSRLSRVTELPLAGLELSQRKRKEVRKSGRSALCVTIVNGCDILMERLRLEATVIKLSSPHNSFILEFLGESRPRTA